MSRDQVILGLVALVLVVFSLVVSMVIPRRNADFPGRNLRLFTIVSVLLVVAMLAAVEVFGDEGHAEGQSAEAEVEAADTGPGDTGEVATETVPTETTEQGEGAPPAADVARGKEIFLADCGSCHVLADAGTEGTVGPNLDDAQPSFEETLEQVTNGGGGMPAFEDQLSEEEIEAVSAYVAEASG